MMKRSHLGVVLGAAFMASSLVYLACDSSGNAVKEQNPAVDSGKLGDGAPSAEASADGALPDGDCFLNPTTHFEIINACTDAVKITKNPTLPLLLTDGGLPPLP